MIRYPITKSELYSKIDTESSTWRKRAERRTKELANGTRKNITGIWSEIKQVFMDLQGPKCAICEKWIEGQVDENDIDHFRPKKQIRPWRVPQSLRNENIEINQDLKLIEEGYKLLSYNPLNYAITCRSCNSRFKSKYFPIAGTRENNATDPTKLKDEKAYLIFPIGSQDKDPEKLIHFHALSPQPKRSGFERKRALVTIDIYKLDDVKIRSDLLLERAERIEHLYFALERRANPLNTQQENDTADRAINRLLHSKRTHTNCLRCYKKLWDEDQAEAKDIYHRIEVFLESKSPSDYRLI